MYEVAHEVIHQITYGVAHGIAQEITHGAAHSHRLELELWKFTISFFYMRLKLM